MKKSILCLAILIYGTVCLASTITPDHSKINTEGTYLPFPGFTIVSDTDDQDMPFFRALYEALVTVPEFKEYYELLPLDSMHMTTNNLFTQIPNYASNWNEFINDQLPWFKKLYQSVEASDVRPRITLSELKGWRGINIGVEVNENDKTIIKNVAEEFKIESKIPAYFHLSLAYLKKDITEADRASLLIKLNTIFNELLIEHSYKGKVLTLKKSNLTYFPDMKSFVPWNAASNPFVGK